jgi:hypothetical protein
MGSRYRPHVLLQSLSLGLSQSALLRPRCRR